MSDDTAEKVAPSNIELERAFDVLRRLTPAQRAHLTVALGQLWCGDASSASLAQIIAACMHTLVAREDKLKRQVREWAETFVGQVEAPAMVELEKLVGEID